MKMGRSAPALLRVASAAVIAVALGSAAQATSNRTYVSGTGDDSNPCTAAFPCRTFAVALANTSAGGEIHALDDANFGGNLNITTSLTITAATSASIGVDTATTGISINAAATDVVVVRNLRIDGNNVANTRGIDVQTGHLVLQDSTLERLVVGISVQNTTTDLVDTNVIGNTTGVKAIGTGDDLNCSPNFTGGTTLVRLSGGNVIKNTTAYLMLNPGANPNTGCTNVNTITIFVRSQNGVYTVNQTGNATLVSGSGGACLLQVTNCTAIGTYQSGVNAGNNPL